LKPINLPESDLSLKNGFECIAIGWGVNESKKKLYENNNQIILI
jgi:hypothetical protein